MGRNYFTRALEENEKIDERFRNLIHDVFDDIYNAMGKKNFLRWINTRKISDRIKNLVVEEFSEKDLKEHPNAGGYYTHGTDREKFRKGHINKNVATHETLHFFSDMIFTGRTFPTFINEGLTEYLNREFEKTNTSNENVGYMYTQNVDFVEFLHNIIGDSLIKTYLTGTSQAFSEEFSTYITEDGAINTVALDRFYDSLNRVHDVLHPQNNPKTDEERKISEAKKRDAIEIHYPEIRKIVGYIASNAIRKKAHDLEYYEDGRLNIGAAIKDVNELASKTIELLGKNRTFGLSPFSSRENMELHESILKNALTAVLQESHIPNEKIGEIVSQSVQNGTFVTRGNVTSCSWPRIKNEELLEQMKAFDEESVTKNLFDKRLGNAGAYTQDRQFNITSFLMDASLVLDKMGVEKDLRQMFLDSAILRHLPQDVDRDLVKTMIDKHSKLYVALYQKQQENKRNVVDSKFVKISDTKFVEKRDNKLFFIDFDEKTGTFSEQKIRGEYADQRMRFSKEDTDKFGDTVKRVTYIHRKPEEHSIPYTLMFNEDFSVVTVGGKSHNVMQSPEKLGDAFLVDEAMRPVIEGMKTNKYVTILNDAEEPAKGSYTGVIPDERSRVINYSLFLKELEDSIANVPKVFQKNIEKDAIISLISNTYFIKPENLKEIQEYLSKISLRNITDENVISRLYEYTQNLNQHRRNYVVQKSKDTAICFNSEEAKRRYHENAKAKEKRKRRKEFNQDVKAFISMNSMDCITEPLEMRTDEEHHSTMEGVKYYMNQKAQYRTATAGKVDYDAFCNRLKEASANVDEEKRSMFITRVISDSIDIWYGNGTGYPGDNKILDEREELTDKLAEFLTNKINGDVEIDIVSAREIEGRFLQLSNEEETICKEILEKRVPRSYENANVKKDYEHIKAIHEMEAVPEDAKNMIIEGLKEKSKHDLTRKKRMDAFAKLALSGEHIPSEEDIRVASKVIDFYGDINIS